MTTATAKTTTREYRCACCGRRLKKDRWIFSTWTRSRYCWPTEGCWVTKRRPRRATEGGQS